MICNLIKKLTELMRNGDALSVIVEMGGSCISMLVFIDDLYIREGELILECSGNSGEIKIMIKKDLVNKIEETWEGIGYIVYFSDWKISFRFI